RMPKKGPQNRASQERTLNKSLSIKDLKNRMPKKGPLVSATQERTLKEFPKNGP
ncbi:hypothetical protein BpHYR1_003314, partial [Brachionus plicatilis]